MEHAVTKIDPRGGAAMRDAIRLSVGELKEKAKRDKRVILVVTDGNDNASVTSLDALTRLAQQDDVLVYAIGLLTDEEKQKVKKVGMEFDVFVESTGGHVFYPNKGCVRCGTYRSGGCTRHPRPVHDCVHIRECHARRKLSPDQSGDQGSGRPRRPRSQRLLRDEGPSVRPTPCGYVFRSAVCNPQFRVRK